MKTIDEMTKVMEYYKNGGEIEYCYRYDMDNWEIDTAPEWNWVLFDYRIKPISKTFIVTMEKWLICNIDKTFSVIETSNISGIMGEKVKLLDSYEIEIDRF